jgi:hypothetical protein
MRRASARSWSQAKGREFLSVLAETVNVSEACRQSGISMTKAYRRRKTDAAFRAGWAEAISVGYQRLELVLLERAFVGTEKVVRRRDGSEELMREYSDQLGLQLLKLHRDTAAEAEAEIDADEFEELKERLVRKLQRLKKRDEEQGAGSPELRDERVRTEAVAERAGGDSAQDHRRGDA